MTVRERRIVEYDIIDSYRRIVTYIQVYNVCIMYL